MKSTIEELTLLLMYLTSWKEGKKPDDCTKSWKGYDFDVINELIDKEFINGNYRSKSVYFTEDGINKAKELMKKYIIEE